MSTPPSYDECFPQQHKYEEESKNPPANVTISVKRAFLLLGGIVALFTLKAFLCDD